MNKLTLTTLMAGLVAVSATAPAFADHQDDQDDERYDSRGDVVYAPVVSSRPSYRQVRVSEPRQECRDERVVYRDRGYGGNPAGAILGGIIGGVAGHQIGGGHGRDVATALGAVIGAGIGGQSGRGYDDRERVNYEQRCDTVNDYRYEERVDGYDVTYRYNGRLYNTRLPYDPGRRIALNVDVQPLRY
jgi:uncharacterized protein YcfJ